jgi:Cu2+-exporting ATPase/Cu+-exporting ATPase
MRRRFFRSLLFTLPLFVIAMFDIIKPLSGREGFPALALTELLLCVPVMFINREILADGFRQLLKLRPNMYSLIACGVGVSFVWSIVILYRAAFFLSAGETFNAFHLKHELYFDSAAMILTLITLGKFLEARAKRRTSDSIQSLLDLAPKTARLKTSNGEEIIPSAQIKRGDIVIVKAGETFPADGFIASGSGTVSEAMLTGEPIPADKREKDRVTGGTVLVSGFVEAEITASGEDTALAKIIALVDEATSSKAPSERLADTVAGVFVPVVLGIAALTLGVWLFAGEDISFALSRAVSVLVISCPCALGLATPTAIMCGTGRGAKFGILSKSAEALENARNAEIIVFDKTGTITEGSPAVAGMWNALAEPLDSQLPSELLTVAAALEMPSAHPLAAAVNAEAKRLEFVPPSVKNWRFIDGRGVVGEIDGVECYGGNKTLMREASVDVSKLNSLENKLVECGETLIYFAKGETPVGVIAIADKIRETAPETVKALEERGLEVILLTGDAEKAAKAIAKRAGIKKVIHGILPEGKEAEIRTLQASGKNVMMIGDGINDAPAIARADCGVAVGNGTDVAIESADIVLMRSDPADIIKLLNLSRLVMRNIKQNLFWAFFYNIIGIPLAAGVFYTAFGILLSPMIAAAAMSVSSVTVVANALRLTYANLDDPKKREDLLEKIITE